MNSFQNKCVSECDPAKPETVIELCGMKSVLALSFFPGFPSSGGRGGRPMQMTIPFYIGARSHPLVPLAAGKRTTMGVQRRSFLPVLVLSALLAVGALEGECGWVVRSKCY